MAYTPPPYNAVNFAVNTYSPPAYNAVNFDLQPWDPVANKPTNLILQVITIPSKIKLTWQEGAPEQVGDGFRIYRSDDGGAFVLKQTLPLNVCQWEDTSTRWNVLYRYKVVEYKPNQESDPAYVRVAMRLGGEMLALSDGDAWLASRTSAESLVLAAISRANMARKAPESLAVAEWPLRAVAGRRAEALGLGVALRRAVMRIYAEVLILNAVDRAGIGRTTSEQIPLVESGFRGVGRTTGEALTLTEAWGRVLMLDRLGEETLDLTAAIRRDVTRAAAEALAFSSVVRKKLWTIAKENLDLSDGDAQAVVRVIAETLALIAEASRVCEVRRTEHEWLDLSDVWIREIGKQRGEVLPLVERTERGLTSVIEENLALATEMFREVRRTALRETLNLAVIGKKGIGRQADEALSLAVTYHRVLDAVRTVGERLGLGDGDAQMIARLVTETLYLGAIGRRQMQWVRTLTEALKLLATPKVPGGGSRYRYDVEPFDAKIIKERLTRRVRAEDV